MPSTLNTIKEVEHTPYGDYPKTCSFCKHFCYSRSSIHEGKNATLMVADPDSAYCKKRTRYGEMYRFPGINPSLEIPKDCEHFALPRYYYGLK